MRSERISGMESSQWLESGAGEPRRPMSRFSVGFVARMSRRIARRPTGLRFLLGRKGNKSLRHSYFPPDIDAASQPPISSFASLRGFVIRLPVADPSVRLFLGSSAVEHSTVNRMVAGSNPARGAKYRNKISKLFKPTGPCPRIFENRTRLGRIEIFCPIGGCRSRS
jgi:hypothetical protein